MVAIKLFFCRLRILPHVLFLIIKDYVKWIKNRGWKQFEDFGLNVYIGPFGNGKTCSIVRDAYNIACRYDGINILTNVTLTNFPDTCNILPLKCGEDIINAPDNCVVILDELGTIFNSRDFQGGKANKDGSRGIPKPVFQTLVQVRHRHILVLAGVQDWRFIDKQIRQVAKTVTVCSAWLWHPFTRMITNRVFDAKEYDMFYDNPLLPLTELDAFSYVQTDKLRSLYDTKEMVQTLLEAEYISDKEILENQRGDPSAPSDVPTDKKKQKELLNKIKKAGL